MSWKFLPREILVLIFGYYIEDEGQKELLTTIAKVCSQWKDACYDSYLLRTCDGTLPIKTLIKLSSKSYLQRTEKITLNKISESSPKPNDVIFRGLPELKCIHFTEVKNLDDNCFLHISEHCPNVCDITLSSCAPLSKEFYNFLTVSGSNVVSLHLFNQKFSSGNRVMKIVPQNCCNLQNFYYIQCSFGTFIIDHFEVGCPKLKILSLDDNVRICKGGGKNKQLGFPFLEQFAYVEGRSEMCDKKFTRLLFNSEKLKLLDIRGCKFITSDALFALPAHSIEYLYVSMSGVGKSVKICNLFARWKSTLKVVDISRMHSNFINDAVLMLLVPGPRNELEELNLNGTPITVTVVKKVLMNCKKLKVLHLESCRELKKGLKRVYRSRQELEVLFEKLSDTPEILVGDK